MDHAPLLCDPAAKAQLENNNAVDQIDTISYIVNGYCGAELRESHLLELHRLAVKDIYPCGGKYRTARNHIRITCSDHEVPESALVQLHVHEALRWVNEAQDSAPLERAAFVLWRFNWIHPFCGGNGRTSRALAYLILCMAEGMMLPGAPVMPDLIYTTRRIHSGATRGRRFGSRCA